MTNYQSTIFVKGQYQTRQLPSQQTVLPFFQSYMCTLDNTCLDTKNYEETTTFSNAPWVTKNMHEISKHNNYEYLGLLPCWILYNCFWTMKNYLTPFWSCLKECILSRRLQPLWPVNIFHLSKVNTYLIIYYEKYCRYARVL